MNILNKVALFNDIKLVYSGIYYQYGEKEYILNGCHPKLKEHIENTLHMDSNGISIQDVQEDIAKINENSSWRAHISHSNFYKYIKAHHGKTVMITESDIVNDGTVYIYPIEICYTLDYMLANYQLTLDGETYIYTIMDTIHPRVLEGLRAGYVKFLVNWIHDPLSGSHGIRKLEQLLFNEGIASENIIFVGGNKFDAFYQDYPDSQLKITSGIMVLDQINQRLTDEYPGIGTLGYKSDYVRPSDLDPTYIRSKKFICLNRNVNRRHRLLSAFLAAKYNLLENSIFSFIMIYGYNNKEAIKDALINYIDYGEELLTMSEKIAGFIPLEVDTMHLSSNKNGFALNNNKKEFYAETYINIVNETAFEGDPNSPFISEKTLHHPIINLQPFIVIGNTMTIRTLNELGFKTFHPIIDESYDQCHDPKQRFRLIETEVKKLSELPQEKLHKLYYGFQDILLHNQEHAKSYANYNPFEEAFKDIRKWYIKNGI